MKKTFKNKIKKQNNNKSTMKQPCIVHDDEQHNNYSQKP